MNKSLLLFAIIAVLCIGAAVFTLYQNTDETNTTSTNTNTRNSALISWGDQGYIFMKEIVIAVDPSNTAVAAASRYETYVVYPSKNITALISTSTSLPNETLSKPTTTSSDGSQIAEWIEAEDRLIIEPNDRLQISTSDGTPIMTLKPADFSSYPALIPIAFSGDGKQLLIQATTYPGQEPESPSIFFIQEIADEHTEILATPQQNETQMTELFGFTGVNHVYGFRTSRTEDGALQSQLITLNTLTRQEYVSDFYVHQILEKASDGTYLVTLTIDGKVLRYNPISYATETVAEYPVAKDLDTYRFSSNYQLAAFTQYTEQQSSEVRGTGLANGNNATEIVTDTIVFDAQNQRQETIFSSVRHKGGVNVGDEYKVFESFVTYPEKLD